MFLGKLFTPLLDSLSGSLFDWWSSAGHELPISEAIAPEDIFEAGDIGYVADPSDYSTMFQDSAGTVPVTALYQPVGRVNDKNGSALHMAQSTTPSRPELRLEQGIPSLYQDGIDDEIIGSFTSGSGYYAASVAVCGIDTGGRSTAVIGRVANFSLQNLAGNGISAYGLANGTGYYAYGGFLEISDYAYARIVDIPASDTEPLTVIAVAEGSEMKARTYQSAGWQNAVGTIAPFDGVPAGLTNFGIYNSGVQSSVFGGFWIDRKITDLEAEGILEYYKQKVT